MKLHVLGKRMPKIHSRFSKKWEPVEEEYYDGDLAEFNNLWYNRASVCTVYDLSRCNKTKTHRNSAT